MSENKIVVPEGMRAAAYIAACNEKPGMIHISTVEIALDAACRWLSENPIVPTDVQAKGLHESYMSRADRIRPTQWVCVEWQRRMFLDPEPRIPEEIKDLIREQTLPTGQWYTIGVDVHNHAILEAFRRGQKAGTR